MLRDWIMLDYLNWEYLSKNPNAIELLREKIKKEKDMDIDYLNNLDGKDKTNLKLNCDYIFNSLVVFVLVLIH